MLPFPLLPELLYMHATIFQLLIQPTNQPTSPTQPKIDRPLLQRQGKVKCSNSWLINGRKVMGCIRSRALEEHHPVKNPILGGAEERRRK